MAIPLCFDTHTKNKCLRRLGTPRGPEHGSLEIQEATNFTTNDNNLVHERMYGKGGLANQEALNREAWQSRRPQTAKHY